MLYGRRAECDALERLLADARRSRSGALVIRGEAGAGKSAPLDHAAGLADGMTVLRAAVVVQLVADGGTNREIGAQLFLSRRTIDYHLRNVFVKLGVSARAELIRLALADR